MQQRLSRTAAHLRPCRGIGVLLLISGAAYVPRSAYADFVLPSSSFFATVQDGSGGFAPGTYIGSRTNDSGTQQSVTNLAYDLSNPGVSQLAEAQAIATVSATASGAPLSNAQGRVDYSFELVGPDPTTIVPVQVVGNLVATLTGTSFPDEALATLTVGAGGSESIFARAEINRELDQSSQRAFTFVNQTLQITPFVLYEVTLNALAHIEENSPGDYSAQAVADPLIQIDPIFAAANPGYSIVFSPNPAPVPLPPTLPLLSVALAWIGLHRRANRNRRPAGSSAIASA